MVGRGGGEGGEVIYIRLMSQSFVVLSVVVTRLHCFIC